MPTPQIPVRTALGQEELRQRRGELGQRHRTILFMVDGRRELAEVLSLAHQAGASTMHFEDLVRHGLVELPNLTQPSAPAVEPALSEAAIQTFEAEPSGHLARVDVVELPVAAPEPVAIPEPVAEPAPREPERRAAPALSEPVLPVLVEAEPVRAPLEPVPMPKPVPLAQPLPQPIRQTLREPRREPVREAREPVFELPVLEPVVPVLQAAEAPKRQRFRVSRGLKPAKPPEAAQRFVPPIAAPNLIDDETVLADVRALVLEALRLDPPGYGSRLPQRVRSATDTQQIIDMIWEMERDPNHPRRSHRGKARLHDARELLGMGNTQVAEDSRPDITEF